MDKGEIILYKNTDGRIKLDVQLLDDTVWLNRNQMALLFNRDVKTIGKHINNIFNEGELQEGSTVAKFATVQKEGGRHINRNIEYYNLDVIISVGYRVKSQQGTQFRIWATQRLKEYIIKGFALNDERFKSGNSMNFFDELQDRIREIRLSEKFFYQKIKDIYITSIDYDPKDEKTRSFFKIVQNKLLWAISQQTAAELVYRRVDGSLPLLGMLSSDKKSIKKADASIAKNYLNEDEIKLLGLLVEQYLAFAETMAQQHTPMYMQDWIERLDVILKLNGREILTHTGKISHQMALDKSSIEYNTYKEVVKANQIEQSLKEIEADIKKLE